MVVMIRFMTHQLADRTLGEQSPLVHLLGSNKDKWPPSPASRWPSLWACSLITSSSDIFIHYVEISFLILALISISNKGTKRVKNQLPRKSLIKWDPILPVDSTGFFAGYLTLGWSKKLMKEVLGCVSVIDTKRGKSRSRGKFGGRLHRRERGRGHWALKKEGRTEKEGGRAGGKN